MSQNYHHPSPSRSTQQQAIQRQHAFGSDSEDDNQKGRDLDNRSDSDDDDDGAGFQVYKDQPTRYINVATAPQSTISPTSDRHSTGPIISYSSPTTPTRPSYQSDNRLGINTPKSGLFPQPTYGYPPPDEQIALQAKQAYQPTRSELVQMPALGSDWDKDESRRDKDWEGKDTLINKAKWQDRKSKLMTKTTEADHHFRDFLAGRRKLGGWLDRFVALGILLVLLLLSALLSFFLVPRVPSVAYNNETTLLGDSSNGLSFQTQQPVSFSFNGKINLAMTAPNSYIQPKTSQVTVIIKDLSSSSMVTEVGRGTLSNHVAISKHDYTPLTVDLQFRYSGSSDKDLVWKAWHEACGHKWPGREDRPTLQLGVIVEFGIVGLLGTFSERTVLNNVTCPVELPANAA